MNRTTVRSVLARVRPPKRPQRDPLLVVADRLVNQDRQDDYGDPRVMHERYAQAWSVILRHHVTAEQVALCMAALKLVRAGGRKSRDDLADAVGYIDIADKCRKE